MQPFTPKEKPYLKALYKCDNHKCSIAKLFKNLDKKERDSMTLSFINRAFAYQSGRSLIMTEYGVREILRSNT